MAIEIERKFLVKDDSWFNHNVKGINIKQGYLKNSIESVVRIRIYGDKGFITVKGKIKKNRVANRINSNLSRLEFEYEIPVNDAFEMLELCENPLIEKIRYQVHFMGFDWIIDWFEGDNLGLVIAEIEIETEDQMFEKPSWAGIEVTDEPRYFNSNLIKNPFRNW